MNDAKSSLPGENPGPEDAPASRGRTDTAFPVVDIGASAGGLEAVSQLLEALPPNTGMAFVLVQHLDPKHESKLDSILAKATAMPVRDATNGTAVETDRLYIIPPNATMAIADGVLHLEPRGEGGLHHLPVDAFFKSLAEDRHSGAIGVVLSGTGSDGTLGLEDLKAAGGITFAQSEESAKYAGMPMSAVRSGCVDLVLPPAEIARELARIGQHPYVTTAASAADGAQPEGDEASFRRILSLLRATFGVDFGTYRDTTIRRRMMRRMVLNVKEDLADYALVLEKDRAELDALYHDMLINVTSFFREPATFEALKQSVFPEIVKGKSTETPVRIWVPGCSTGQEAYSLAMALTEFLDDKPVAPPIQIFATDLSDMVALQRAREGLYPENIAAEVSPERLRRFFTREEGKFRVIKAIRDLCLFAKQNVAADPPFSRVDLISCRNLLIYLAPQLQKRVIPTFHYALNPGGFLLLGASEAVGAGSDLFALVERQHRIYRKRDAAVRAYPHFIVEDHRPGMFARPRARELEPAAADWLREADRLVLTDYSPPGVLVNEDFQILQFRGETGSYLKPAPGEASLNVLKMAREGLFLELRSAIAEAHVRKAEVRHRNIRVRGEAGTRKIDVRVLPVRVSGRSEECFLILFEEDAPGARSHRSASGPAGAASAQARFRQWVRRLSLGKRHSTPPDVSEGSLRRELASTQEYLQSVIEEQDAANEELKSANEEILSTNEELQSTNEELETAKEELQSVNEELTTVNEQLQTRNLELSRLNDDVTNLITSTNLPMVAVGVDLRIRRVTPAAAKLFNMLATDVGRPIGNLKPAVDVPDLETLIAEVIDKVTAREREVRDRDGRHHLLRIHPYRTADNKIDGAVVVLFDVEEVTAQAERLRQKAALLAMSSDAIIARDKDSVITFWNHGAERTYGWRADEAVGKNSHALLQNDSGGAGDEIDAMLRAHDRWQGEIPHVRRDGTIIIVESRQVVERGPGGDVAATLEINRDITERKRILDQLAEADRRKNEFLATIAHELRNPLAPVQNGMQLLNVVDSNSPEAGRAREMIERNLRRMTRLIDDLLDISRITHGHIELRREPVDVNVVVREVEAELHSMAEGSRKQVSLGLAAEPAHVNADRVRLVQIVENLLHNAIKYTDDGGRIAIAVAREGGEVVLRVKDTGIGIDGDSLARIWEPFVQVDTALERRRSGLGLGLTLVRTLVDLHGGSISAASEGPGKGSEFVVRLPRLDAQAAGKADSGGQPEAKPLPRSHRILIVDDNVDAADTFAALLKLMGHDTCTASDGLSALRTARDFRPEVVLVDLALPGINGYEVARRLRELPENGSMLIAAVTGYGSPEDRQRSAEAGLDAHFVKPLDIDALQGMIASRQAG